MGFAGLPHEVSQQQREQEEGRLLSQRWLSSPPNLNFTKKRNYEKTQCEADGAGARTS